MNYKALTAVLMFFVSQINSGDGRMPVVDTIEDITPDGGRGTGRRPVIVGSSNNWHVVVTNTGEVAVASTANEAERVRNAVERIRKREAEEDSGRAGVSK